MHIQSLGAAIIFVLVFLGSIFCVAFGLIASTVIHPENDIYEAGQVLEGILKNREDNSKRQIFKFFREYMRERQQEVEGHIGQQQQGKDGRRTGASSASDTARGVAEEDDARATNKGTEAEVFEPYVCEYV